MVVFTFFHSRFSELQQFIRIETNIPVTSQLILYEECFLKDIIKDDMPLSTYPKTTHTSPYILIRTNDVSQCTMPEERNFWYYSIVLGKLYEPRSEKTGLQGFRPGPTQTGLYSHRICLEA